MIIQIWDNFINPEKIIYLDWRYTIEVPNSNESNEKYIIKPILIIRMSNEDNIEKFLNVIKLKVKIDEEVEYDIRSVIFKRLIKNKLVKLKNEINTKIKELKKGDIWEI